MFKKKHYLNSVSRLELEFEVRNKKGVIGKGLLNLSEPQPQFPLLCLTEHCRQCSAKLHSSEEGADQSKRKTFI